MRYLFSEYGDVIITAMVSLLLALIFSTYIFPNMIESSKIKNEEVVMEDNEILKNTEKPILSATSATVDKGYPFDYHNFVQAFTPEEYRDISDRVEIVKGEVNTDIPGDYTLTFKVTYNGVSSYAQATYIVD